MKKWWIVAAVLVVVLATTGVVYAAKVQGPAKRPAAGVAARGGMSLLGKVAEATGMKVQDVMTERKAGKSYSQILTAKGKDPAALISQMVANMKTFLDKFVAAGKLTQDKATTQLKTYETALKAQLESTKALPERKAPAQKPGNPSTTNKNDKATFHRAMPGRNFLTEISKTTGLTVQDLMKERQAGKSFSQILTAKGKDPAALISQMVAQAKQNFDKMVAAGKLTQEKATQFLQQYEAGLKKMMEDTTVRQPKTTAPRAPRPTVKTSKPL
jgi:polyhydroxyalkanoate synthesis regulator phasin